MILEHVGEALGRPVAPCRQDYRLALIAQRLCVCAGDLEDIEIGPRALRREIPADACAEVGLVARCIARHESGGALKGQRGIEIGWREIELVGRQDAAFSRVAGRLQARLIIVPGLREPFGGGLAGQRRHRDQRVLWQIVEQGFEMIVEQRQPVLHPLPADRGPRGFIGGVARGRAEGGEIFLAETAQHLVVEQHLADRCEGRALQGRRGTLGFRIELSEAFEEIAEEIEPQRLRRGRREDVDNAPAHGIFPAFAHSGNTDIAIDLEIVRQRALADRLADSDGKAGGLQERPWRHALDQRARGGDDQDRDRRLVQARHPGKRRTAGRCDGRRRADPVIGQDIPARQVDTVERGIGELRDPQCRDRLLVVARDIERRAAALAEHARQRQDVCAEGGASNGNRTGQAGEQLFWCHSLLRTGGSPVGGNHPG